MTPASFVRDLTAFWVQVAFVVIVVAGLLKVVAMPARARYVCLRLALLACLAAPWMLRSVVVVTPEPRPAGIAGAVAPVSVGPLEPLTAAAAQSATAAPAYVLSEIPWATVALVALFAGVAARGLWLAVGVLRLRRLRRRAMLVDSPDYAAAQQQVGTSAAIAQVDGLLQPVTFGFRRPIVLLPETLANAPAALRRAVVTHELFHVRRRDWLSVLGEEALRTLLWFHPAILWLTSHIQLAREEMVDELTVRATGDRRAYMQALLAFADTGGIHPAPAFAHRRQLFHRILSVSKKKAMSVPRIVASGVIVVAALAGASWYASTLFPILKAANAGVQASAPSAAGDPASAQSDARVMHILHDGNASLADEVTLRTSSAEVLFERQTGNVLAIRPITPVTPENPIPRRTRGVAPVRPSRFADVHVVISPLVTLDRNGTVMSVARDACYVSGGNSREEVCAAFFEPTAAAIRQWRYERPAQGPIQFYVHVRYQPGAEPTITQSGADWPAHVRETQDSLRALAQETGGIAIVDQRHFDQALRSVELQQRLAELTNSFRELERAQRLALERAPANPDLVKLQQELARLNDELARVEQQIRNTRPQLGADQLTTDADLLRVAVERLREAQRQLEAERRQPEVDGSRQLVSPSGRTPLRVGGQVRSPIPIKQVRPQHSAEAMRARVEGTVTIAALVDEQGQVADARIVKSIPLLDQSALEAAKQWEFKPATLNGEPVPVLVMLELNFTLRD